MAERPSKAHHCNENRIGERWIFQTSIATAAERGCPMLLQGLRCVERMFDQRVLRRLHCMNDDGRR